MAAKKRAPALWLGPTFERVADTATPSASGELLGGLPATRLDFINHLQEEQFNLKNDLFHLGLVNQDFVTWAEPFQDFTFTNIRQGYTTMMDN